MTLADIKTLCEYKTNNSRLWNKYDAATLANAAANRVATDMGFHAKERVSSTPTVNAQRTYSLPSDFLFLTGDPTIEFADGTDRHLVPVTVQELDIAHPNDATPGEPTHYSITGDTVVLYPVPNNATSTIRIRYSPTPAAMGATTDSPGVPARYHDLVMDRLVADLYEVLGDSRTKEAVVKYEVALQRAKVREAVGTGGMLPSMAWMKR